MLAVNNLTMEFVKQFLVKSISYLALAGETHFCLWTVNNLTREFVKHFLINSITCLALAEKHNFFMLTVVGKLLLQSTGVTLLLLSIKETHYF
jgi:hypothetical protein